MALRIARESWVIRDGSAVAVNVNSGIVLSIDETESPNISLFAYHLSNRQGVVLLGIYSSRADAVVALDQIANSAG